MPFDDKQLFRGSAAELLLGAAALALLTWICFWLQLNIATTVPLYMIVVVLLSLRERLNKRAEAWIWACPFVHWRRNGVIGRVGCRIAMSCRV